MYKIRTTAKELRQSAPYAIRAGYCELQNLLHYAHPFAYTCGVYGWNCDAYLLPYDMLLTTGYRGMVGRRPRLAAEYDRAAERIIYSRYEVQKRRPLTTEEYIQALLEEFARINTPYAAPDAATITLDSVNAFLDREAAEMKGE